MKYVSFFLFLFISFNISAQDAATIYNLEQYQNRVFKKNDTMYIVNFWATWCKPCVEELPYFQQLADSTKQLSVKIILVSQDTKSRVAAVAQFIKNKSYTSEYFVLSAGNPNVWIDKIAPQWSGTIPATIIYKNGKKINFKEGDFESFDDLNSFITIK